MKKIIVIIFIFILIYLAESVVELIVYRQGQQEKYRKARNSCPTGPLISCMYVHCDKSLLDTLLRQPEKCEAAI